MKPKLYISVFLESFSFRSFYFAQSVNLLETRHVSTLVLFMSKLIMEGGGIWANEIGKNTNNETNEIEIRIKN